MIGDREFKTFNPELPIGKSYEKIKEEIFFTHDIAF